MSPNKLMERYKGSGLVQNALKKYNVMKTYGKEYPYEINNLILVAVRDPDTGLQTLMIAIHPSFKDHQNRPQKVI